jgi:hypothetical protein
LCVERRNEDHEGEKSGESSAHKATVV